MIYLQLTNKSEFFFPHKMLDYLNLMSYQRVGGIWRQREGIF